MIPLFQSEKNCVRLLNRNMVSLPSSVTKLVVILYGNNEKWNIGKDSVLGTFNILEVDPKRSAKKPTDMEPIRE